VNEYQAIVLHNKKLKQVGIVGEIYLKFNSFSHKNIIKQLQIELDKASGDFVISDTEVNTTGEPVDLYSLSLYELCKIAPEIGRKIKDEVFEKAKTERGFYRCSNPKCGKESPYRALFHIDHINPMSKGGKTTPNNLQLLCRSCNIAKGDK